MPYRLLKVEPLGGLTEKLLKQHEDLETVPGERDLAKPRLRFIRKLIESGEFNRCEWGTCRCKKDKKTYRVNGQHTSNVLRQVLDGKIEGAEFPADVPVIVHRYECDDMDDLANVFDQFDQHKSTRKPEDKLGIFMAQHVDLIGIDKKLCGQVLGGIAWGTRRVPNIESLCEGFAVEEAYDRGVLLNVDEVRDFIDLLHQHSGAPFREWQQKTGIIARMFSLFIEDRENAEVAIEQLLYEAGDDAAKFTREIRSNCTKNGKDAGFYFRKTEKYFRSALEAIETQGRDVIKALIKEVIEESNSPEGSEAA